VIVESSATGVIVANSLEYVTFHESSIFLKTNVAANGSILNCCLSLSFACPVPVKVKMTFFLSIYVNRMSVSFYV
jgi:hypothetical protein